MEAMCILCCIRLISDQTTTGPASGYLEAYLFNLCLCSSFIDTAAMRDGGRAGLHVCHDRVHTGKFAECLFYGTGAVPARHTVDLNSQRCHCSPAFLTLDSRRQRRVERRQCQQVRIAVLVVVARDDMHVLAKDLYLAGGNDGADAAAYDIGGHHGPPV